MGNLPKVAEIFEQVCRLPKDARDRAVRDACGDNQALHTELQRLLSIASEGHATVVGGVAEEADLFIGGFRLIKTIGEGGFGVVYLGERVEPPFYRAAIKVLRSERDTNADLERFRQEAELLTTFSHPNIARLLDVGLTETGRPYIAIEYIDGEPIQEFCNTHNLTIEERLELFAPVCEAIQHANAHGVIHRDLKPGNILVTEVLLSGDDKKNVRRVAKVIDFGVAKVLRGPASNRQYRTIGGWIGSIEYMSPEQVEGRASDLGPATDVYGLGAVLFELLVGRPPFTIEELQDRGEKEMLRVLREEERPKPSTRLSSGDLTSEQVAQKRKTSPDRLSKTLRKRFLDQIVATAMRVRPEDRYANAGLLRDDIQAFLDDRPLRCMSDYWWYEVRRVVRRHRAPFAVVAAVVLTLAVSLVVMSTLWHRALKAEADAKSQTEKTSESLAQTQTLLDTVLMTSASSLRRVDGVPEIRSDMTVGEYLDLLRRRIDSAQLTPRTRSDALVAMARTHQWLQNADKAMEAITESVKVRRPLLLPESIELADTLQGVMDTYLGVEGANLPYAQVAESAGLEALAIRTKLLGADDPLTVRTSIDLEWIRLAPAQGHLSLFDPAVLGMAQLMCGLTPRADAEADVRRIVEHVETIWNAGQHEEAVQAIFGFLQSSCPRLDKEDRDRKAPIMLGIAQGIRWRSNYRGATMAALEAAVRTADDIHGVDSPRAIQARYIQGDEMVDRGEFKEAIAYLEPVLEQASAKLGADHSRTSAIRTQIAVARIASDGFVDPYANIDDPELLNGIAWRICRAAGRSKAQYQNALEAVQRALKKVPENPDAVHTLGVCQMRLGLLAEAEESLLRAIALRSRRGLGPMYDDHGYLAILYAHLDRPSLVADHMELLRKLASKPGAELDAVRLSLMVEEEVRRSRDRTNRP